MSFFLFLSSFFLLCITHRGRGCVLFFFLILLHKKGRQLSPNVFKAPRGYQQKRKTKKKKKVTKIGEKKKNSGHYGVLYGSVCEHQEKKREQSSSRECGIATSKWISLPQQLGFFFFLLRHSPPSLPTDIRLHTTDKQTRAHRPPVSRERKKKHPSFPLFVLLPVTLAELDDAVNCLVQHLRRT